MPTAARAQPKKPPKQPTKPAAKPAAKPATPAPVAAAVAPLKEAKSQLVAFNASAFPYRGFLPDSRTPWLQLAGDYAAIRDKVADLRSYL